MTSTSPKPLARQVRHLRQFRHLRLAVVGAAVVLPLAACGPTPGGYHPPAPTTTVAPTTTTTPPPWLAAGCLDSTDPMQADILFNGTENVLNNSAAVGTLSPFSVSTDGTCTGDDTLATATLARAADETAAIAVCGGIDPLFIGAVNLVSLGYSAPADAWGCYALG